VNIHAANTSSATMMMIQIAVATVDSSLGGDLVALIYCASKAASRRRDG
jgi:hypothetical protein